MFPYYRTQGLVFKIEDQFEADQMFSVFTKDFGRVEIFGKAIRKINSKLKSGIEIFSLSKIEFIQGKHKKTLTDALFVEKFKNIYQIPEKFEVAIKISNLIDDFIRGEEKDDNIFNLLNDTFSKLNNYQLLTTNYQLIYFYFFWNFISILGYEPELSKCAICRQKLNPHNLYFSNKEGGIICKKCLTSGRDGVKIEPDVVKVLRLIVKKVPMSQDRAGIPVAEGDLGNWNTLSKLKMGNDTRESLKEVSENYYRYLLPNYKYE